MLNHNFFKNLKEWVKDQYIWLNTLGNRFDPSETLILAGSPRSGTTWLAEALQNDHRFLLWEPLNHPPEWMKFKARPYLDKYNKEKIYYNYFLNLLSGKKMNVYSLRNESAFNLRSKSDLLIKFCRGHMILPYLFENFNIKKPVFLIRNPIDVINSQLNYGPWDNIPQKVFWGDLSKELWTDELIEISKLVKSQEERLAFFWCLENSFLVKSENKSFLLIYYEDILEKWSEETKKIEDEWGVSGLSCQENKEYSSTKNMRKSNEYLVNPDKINKIVEKFEIRDHLNY